MIVELCGQCAPAVNAVVHSTQRNASVTLQNWFVFTYLSLFKTLWFISEYL